MFNSVRNNNIIMNRISYGNNYYNVNKTVMTNSYEHIVNKTYFSISYNDPQ